MIPALVIGQLAQIRGQRFGRYPGFIQCLRRQPQLIGEQVVTRIRRFKEQVPISVEHELEIQPLDRRQHGLAWHGQKDRRVRTDKDLRRIGLHRHRHGILVAGFDARDEPIERNR